MGLDMTLYAESTKYSQIEKEDYPTDLQKVVGNIFLHKYESERFAVGYFRKFNALHKAIIDQCTNGVDDCQDVYLEKTDLQRILGKLEEVSKDHSKAKTVLPTEDGFFFGSQDYDEYYFDDVEKAKKLFKKLLTISDKYDIVYRASW